MTLSRYAKIVATVGPACSAESQLARLLEAGVDVFRLNFSHGTQADHARVIALVRRLSEQTGKPVSVLLDMQGPKIRVGALPAPIALEKGARVTLFSGPVDPARPDRIPNDFPELPETVRPNSTILLDDGQLELRVLNVRGAEVEAEVIQGGMLKSHKGMNLPNVPITVPGFTEKDQADLAFGLQQGVDLVAVSFVRTPRDIEEVREAIVRQAPDQGDLPLVAKLERPESLENLDAILDVTDGVMVARGDLGVEMSPAAVPIAQKRIIAAANRHGRFVITATQMLDSMIHNPRPTRAETSDVANAVFDGTDAVMLSGETAAGEYPVESVQMMDAVVRQAEAHFNEWGSCVEHEPELFEDDAIALTRAARELAHDRNVAAIAVFTITGRTALMMSKLRPSVPILAFTPDPRTYTRMGVYWGVTPCLVPVANNAEEMIQIVEQSLLNYPMIETGRQVVMISGFPIGRMRSPNFALLHTIGSKVA